MSQLGNTELVDYGIQSEESDLRAHVCIAVERIYVYPTAAGLAACETGRYIKRPAYSWINGTKIKTAEGYLVPPDDIDGCVFMQIPKWLIDKTVLSQANTTTEKGNKAVSIVMAFIKAGGFPFPINGRAIEDYNLQVLGLDILVGINARIQVKCDYEGGPRGLGGTGNLYLQVAECNPLRQI